MKTVKKSQSIVRIWTDSSQKEYDLYISCGKGLYGIKFDSFLRTLEPPSFDYRKKLVEEARRLDSSEETFAKFSILGRVEDIKCEEEKIKVRFLLPGYLNQTWTMYLDPEKQDTKGKIGLKIQCLMKKVNGS